MCVCCIQEEDEVPDDETVNQMIARSEEEFEQFMVNRSDSTSAVSFSFFLHLVSSALGLSCSAWIWTGVAKRPVTPGENPA